MTAHPGTAPATTDEDLIEGDRVEVTVGAPAHGGHCVARIGGPHGRVVFVRHALPGERVTAEITELHRGYLRADAVEIHEASPDRVTPPCPHARPGACGGCDLQHASGDAQLRWKAAVVRDQLTRLAGLTPEEQDQIFVRVEPLPPNPARPATSGHPAVPPSEPVPATGSSPAVPVPYPVPGSAATPSPHPATSGVGAGGVPDTESADGGAGAVGLPAAGEGRGDAEIAVAQGAGAMDGAGVDEDAARLLGWRSRIRYAIDAAGRPGLLQHRSNQVVPIDRCWIAHPAIQGLDLLANDWPDLTSLQAVASTGGDVAVLARPAGSAAPPSGDDLSEAAEGGPLIRLAGPVEVTELAGGRAWRVPAQGFWQVHPSAAGTLVDAVLEMLRPADGEIAWDLYGGAGLFAAALAERTGARTIVVESSSTGAAAARSNLTGLPQAEIVEARVEVALARRRVTGPVDLVVLDPPRAGAGARVVRAIAAARPRAVAYVACDPAALARDLKTFRSLGWRVERLRAFDCFPMTQHIECVAHLVPA